MKTINSCVIEFYELRCAGTRSQHKFGISGNLSVVIFVPHLLEPLCTLQHVEDRFLFNAECVCNLFRALSLSAKLQHAVWVDPADPSSGRTLGVDDRHFGLRCESSRQLKHHLLVFEINPLGADPI